MTPARLQLAGWILRLYAARQVAKGCDDLDWPDWFPVDERESLVREMSIANSKDAEEHARDVHIRLSEPRPGDLVVEVVPFAGGDFPSATQGRHFVWWEGGGVESLLDACEPLADIVKNGPPTMAMTWHVNEEGKRR